MACSVLGRSSSRTQMPRSTWRPDRVVKLSRLADEIAGDQGEQIAGLGEGIVPFGPMPAAVELAGADRIAVGQEDRIGRLVGDHPHPVAREHVGPVGEGRDPPEPLRLALGAQDSARFVEAHELGVGARIELDQGLDDRALAGQRDGQDLAVQIVARAAAPSTLSSISFSPCASSRSGRSCAPFRATLQPRPHPGPLGAEIEFQLDRWAPASPAAGNPRGGSRKAGRRRRSGHRAWRGLRRGDGWVQ